MSDLSLLDPNLLVGAVPARMSTADVCEAVMLVCFGLAWPAANLRMLQTRRAVGKGLAFTGLILVGYLSGAASKLVRMSYGQPLAPVFWLYVLNVLSVAANVFLQWHYRPRSRSRLPYIGPAARRAILALCCATVLWTPMTARAQGPASPAEAGCVDPRLFVGSTHADRRFSAAYGRFVLMADRGDAGAASAALFMYRHGQSLFGSDWSATEGQQARWHALALDASRQATVLPNRADD